MKLSHYMIVKAPGLLNMPYTLKELETHLHLPKSTIRGWLKRGLPYRKDNNGRIIVNGQDFSQWVKASKNTPHDTSNSNPAENSAYCVRCRMKIFIYDGKLTRISSKVQKLSGRCTTCGSSVNVFKRARIDVSE